MSYTIGIDIGTFESKGVLVNPDGKIKAEARRRHEMLVPRPGWAEHDPEKDWWGDFVHISNALISESRVDPRAVMAVCCSAIGPCMLPVDAAGEALMNGVLYGVDNRAAKEVDELTAAIGADVLMERCGNALTSQSVGPKILWFKRNFPELYARMAMVHSSTSYIVSRLTGRSVIDHYTAANFSPLYDIETQNWSTAVTDKIVDDSKLPKILWSSEIAGELTRTAAEVTGLAVGTPILTGTIDAAAEAVSVGVLSPQDMMVMYGSTVFVIMPTSRRVADPRLWYAPWIFEGQHASMAGLATSGTLTHWFRDQFAADLSEENAFAILSNMADSSPPGANGLIMLPYFSGERTPIHDPNAKGMIFGLNLKHNRGDIYRALLEGIAFGTGHIVETFDEAGASPRTLYAVGGGTKNRCWLQATSDVTGLAQIVRRQTIGASYGDAFLASLATGANDIEAISRWNPVAAEVTPDPANTELYKQYFSLFKRLYAQTKDIMAEI